MNHILVALIQRLGGRVEITAEEHAAVHTGGGVIDIGVYDEDGSMHITLVPTDRKLH